ncbi:stabilizer of axonemal microtubules 2 [Euwallacea similis]|uniref:stabilizer of axonemal microtubules 2 n=1 Tax=Euwallacea similis TaxID=1736056 RepID=UPI00344C0CC4
MTSCGQFPGTGRQPLKFNISCLPYSHPPYPSQICACPSLFPLPAVDDSVPKRVVNQCDVNTYAEPDRPNPSRCNVYIPTLCECFPCLLQFPPKLKKKRKYIQPARPKSFAPEWQYLPPELKMADDTIYRKSYVPVEVDKSKQIFPESHLSVGDGKISDNTVNRMTYKPVKIAPTCPVYPSGHKLIDEGPMQDITTHKHEFVPKPFGRPEAVKPFTNLFTSDCPLSDQTVNRMSYMSTDLNSVKVAPIHPTDAIEKSWGKISDKTVNKMSYQPWEFMEPVDMLWMEKSKYQPSRFRMEGNTVNKMSYQPPGTCAECEDNDPDYVDCPEITCDPNPEKRNGPEMCCRPCCKRVSC